MNSYDKTIKSVTEVKTLVAHMTSLGQIMATSEDTSLFDLITEVVMALQYQHQHSMAKSTPTSLLFHPIPPTVRLVDYCRRKIMLKKPEWQVLAERNGWTPPRAYSSRTNSL